MHLFHCGIQKENAVRKNLKPVSQQGVIPWREARRRAGEDIKRVCFMRCKRDIERLVAMSELSDATRIRFASGRGETQVRRGALCDSREAGALCDEVLRRGRRRGPAREGSRRRAGASEERKGVMSSDVENAKRGFGLGRSRAEAFQMRRFAQDSSARLI